MEQFDLNKWRLDNKRKVITRDGRLVRILCTDAKTIDGACIIAAIETEGEEGCYQFYPNGCIVSSYSRTEDDSDLFFADKLIITQEIIDYINKNKTFFELPTPKVNDVWWIRKEATYPTAFSGNPVLELVNDEGMWMRIPKSIVEKDDELSDFEKAVRSLMDRVKGGEDDDIPEVEAEILLNIANRNLPKWRKAEKELHFDKVCIILEDGNKPIIDQYVHEGEWYIEQDDLLRLPKEHKNKISGK